MNAFTALLHGDAVSVTVAVVLLAMSVASWVVILWKARLLKRALRDVARSTAAFWQAPSVAEAIAAMGAFDRETLVLPLVAATQVQTSGTLASSGDRSQQLTRVLRDALHGVLHKLQAGQVLLASVGATAPFVGLLGTVWGIYHALIGIAGTGQVSIDKDFRPCGRGADHDGRGPGSRHSSRAGLQHPGAPTLAASRRTLEGFRARSCVSCWSPSIESAADRHMSFRPAGAHAQCTQPMSDINMTPLIDVMLVLLVIFIITAPLHGRVRVKVDLPQTEGAQSGNDAPQSIVALGRWTKVRAGLSGNDQPIDADLRLALALNENCPSQNRADRSAAAS